MNTIADIRAAMRQLRSTQVMPDKNGNYHAYSLPQLKDGIIWFGCVAAMHPASFLDMFGVRRFRALKRDVSKAKIEAFIKKWKKGKTVAA